MKPKKINYTPTFVKLLGKVPKNQLKSFARQEQIFRQNIYHPKLKTHKLKGKLTGFYSFSVSYSYRIVFHIEKEEVHFDAIGTHSVYK